jgi:sugar phosphate isomerase/epimerase
MKLGVLTVLFAQKPFEEVLDYVRSAGLDMVELGAAAYAASPHCDPHLLLDDAGARKAVQEALASRGLGISALSAHGNPLHPDPAIATPHREGLRITVRLAHALGLNTVNCFSGCPGDSDGAKYPNWVTCPWPSDFLEILEWQWDKKVIPYWREEARFAEDHGVRLAFEMHPGFVVYNPETLLRLRDACGKAIGANFDPSHLFWQGIDPIEAVRVLGVAGAIYHVHAKDTAMADANVRVNGILDTKHYKDELNRAWLFRTVGYGHDALFWKNFVSALRMVGYDDTLSIEHEDSLMSVNEGFRKAVDLLKSVLLIEPTGGMWWA